jgi:hypothetical protein
VRNSDYRIVLPMGEDLPCAICGRWFQKRLDNYHQMFPGKLVPPGNRDRPPYMMMAFFEIALGTEVMQFKVSRVEERNAEKDPNTTRVAILKTELKKVEEKIDEKKKKTVRFDRIAVPPLPSWAKMSKNTGKAIDLGIPPMTPIATEHATKDVSSKATIDS